MAKRKSILNKDSVAFLEKYINNPSPTGYEAEGQKLWLDYIKPYIDDYFIDDYGTTVGVVNPEADYKVVIEAHADEIGWRVNYITDEGYLHVVRSGGSDHQIAPAKRVNIHTKDGIVKGVFGWPAIHTRRDKDAKEVVSPAVDKIFIDCGCDSKEEVEQLGIHVGCVATFDDEFMVLNDNYFVGRAIDNRIGGLIIAEVTRQISENGNDLPFGLYVVNAVQEEVGMRGAQMITETIKPDVAIITDVGHDTTTPHINKVQEGNLKCGKGPLITYAPAIQQKLLDLVIQTAEKEKIPFQREADSRATGTDTDAFAYSNGGVVSALISPPIKYMHTTVESVKKEDVENVIRLIYKTLLQIEDGHNFKYFS